jgi:hypothetical protein
MSPHTDTLSWCRANQSLLFLLNAACLPEKQLISILWSLVWPNWDSNPQSTALEASTLTDAVKTEWTIQWNGQKWCTRQETKTNNNKTHTTICVGHHYTQASTNNINKTYVLLQTTTDQSQTLHTQFYLNK